MNTLSIEKGSHVLTSEHGWLRLNTWKEGLLARAGHDLLLEMKRFQLDLEVGSDENVYPVRLQIWKDDFEVIGPNSLSSKDCKDIRKNIRKHLSGDIFFQGELRMDEKPSLKGEITVGRGRSSVNFALSLDGSELSGEFKLTHKQLGMKPFKVPFGLIKVKDEVDFSFLLRLEHLLS